MIPYNKTVPVIALLPKVISCFWPFFYFSSALDMVDHVILFRSLHLSCGISNYILLFSGLNRASQISLLVLWWLSLVTLDPSGSALDLIFKAKRCSPSTEEAYNHTYEWLLR